MIDVIIAPSQPRCTALVAAGLPVPTPMPVRALIDTGASHSCIDPTVSHALGLVPTGSTPALTASSGSVPHECSLFDVSVFIHHPSMIFQQVNMPVMEIQLAHQGYQALIGRDLLKKFLMIYDGEADQFTLAF